MNSTHRLYLSRNKKPFANTKQADDAVKLYTYFWDTALSNLG
jgi:hypothetical protein